MSSRGETRQRAFTAACELAAAGQRPSIRGIRERLGGGGGQQAIVDGLNDWIDEAARRFAIPGVPEELRAALVALWDLASRQADDRWAQARGALEGRLAASEAAQSAILADLEAAHGTIAEHLAAMATLQGERAALADARDALTLTLEGRNAEVAALRSELDATRVALEQRTGERDTQTLRAQREAQRADATKASLDAAHGQILALQVQVGELTTQAALLGQARAAAEAALVPLGEDLERARQSILDRDNQVQALTAALGREQEGREADVQHWLARLEERQAEVAAARHREATWGEERQRLQEEVGRLRQEVRGLKSREAPAVRRADSGDQPPASARNGS